MREMESQAVEKWRKSCVRVLLVERGYSLLPSLESQVLLVSWLRLLATSVSFEASNVSRRRKTYLGSHADYEALLLDLVGLNGVVIL